MSDIAEMLEEIQDRGLYGGCGWSPAHRGRGCCSTAIPFCCSARTTTSAWPITRACARRPPRPRCAGASGAGASRLVSGNMTVHRRLEEQLAEFKGSEACVLFGSGYLANTGIDLVARARGRRRLLRRAQPREHRRRLPARPCRDVRLRPLRHRAPRVGTARGRGPRRADRHRRRLLDGRRHRAARGDRRARAALRRARDGRRGALGRSDRAGRPRSGRGRRASSTRST